ncbi:MAG: HD-GYP domain-containing protein [Proteobacteria bacterium]|nr:HD-GYP domain-containing protein [Pseudomonadota bacterium]
MQKHIKRSELKPGMFVVSYGLGTFSNPLVRVNTHVSSQAEIDALMVDEAEAILIDTGNTLFLRGEQEQAPPQCSLHEELPAARRLHADALEYVKGFFESMRLGTNLSCQGAVPLVERFVQSVMRNSTAAATLFKLRNHDEYTFCHSINVSVLSVVLGKQLGLGKASLVNLGLAGLLHDAGKERVPASLLTKPGSLTESERRVLKTHPLEGYKALSGQEDIPLEVLRAVLEHHERHDGSGYPRGLKGDDIAAFSRVIVVVDVYDALTSERAYKRALPPAKALSQMFQMRGKQFSEDDIDHFIRCIGVFPVGSFVRLTGGEHGIVISTNPGRPTKPQVKVVLNSRMRPVLPRVLDLEAMEGTPQAQDIAEVLNPADYRLDMERFLSA